MAEQTSSATNVGLRSLSLRHRQVALDGRTLPAVWDTGFRVFSQFDEDGVVLFLLGVIGAGGSVDQIQHLAFETV